MKQLLLSFGILLISSSIFAQNAALVLFSENGETFITTLNGEQQNDTPTNRVRCADLSQEYYQVKIDFDDALLSDFNTNIAVEKGMEITAIIKLNKKGKYVLRPFGVTPLSDVAVEPVTEYVPLPVQESPAKVQPEYTEPVEEVVTTTTTITTTGPKPEQTKETLDIKVTVPGFDVKMDVDMPEVQMETEMTVTETVTTTTTTSPSKMTRPAEEVEVIEQPSPMPGYNGPVGCDWPSDDAEINKAIESINNKSFEESKLTLAQQIAKSKCLTSEQVKRVMMTFGFEDTKLQFAKFAYDYTFDQGNYYVVNDAFSFEMTIDELNEFLEGR